MAVLAACQAFDLVRPVTAAGTGDGERFEVSLEGWTEGTFESLVAEMLLKPDEQGMTLKDKLSNEDPNALWQLSKTLVKEYNDEMMESILVSGSFDESSYIILRDTLSRLEADVLAASVYLRGAEQAGQARLTHGRTLATHAEFYRALGLPVPNVAEYRDTAMQVRLVQDVLERLEKAQKRLVPAGSAWEKGVLDGVFRQCSSMGVRVGPVLDMLVMLPCVRLDISANAWGDRSASTSRTAFAGIDEAFASYVLLQGVLDEYHLWEPLHMRVAAPEPGCEVCEVRWAVRARCYERFQKLLPEIKRARKLRGGFSAASRPEIADAVGRRALVELQSDASANEEANYEDLVAFYIDALDEMCGHTETRVLCSGD
jgi:hypothetical protein